MNISETLNAISRTASQDARQTEEVKSTEIRKRLICCYSDIKPQQGEEPLVQFVNCLTTSIQGRPFTFIHQMRNQFKASLPESGKNKEVCEAFSRLTIAHLLRTVNRNYSKTYKESWFKFLTTLFNKWQFFEPIFFRELMTELVKVFSDLMEVREKFSKPKMIFTWFRPGTDTIEGNPLTTVDFVYDETTDTELLLIALTELVTGINLSFGVHPKALFDLWKALCYCLETGTPYLKKVAFDAICNVIFAPGMPKEIMLQNYFLSCLSAFYELICTGSVANYENAEEIENSFSKCLDISFKREKTIHQCCFDNMALFNFLEEFLRITNTCGLTLITSSDILNSLCNIILYAFTVLDKCGSPLKADILKRIQTALFQHFSLKLSTERLEQCFYQLIVEEMRVTQFRSKATYPDKRQKVAASFTLDSAVIIPSTSATSVYEASIASPTWDFMLTHYQYVHNKIEEKSELTLKDVKDLQVTVTAGVLCIVNLGLSVYKEIIILDDQNLYPKKSDKILLKLFPDDAPIVLTEICFRLMQWQPSINMYRIIVKIVSALVYAQEKFNTPEMWPMITAILCYPWLNSLATCDDYATKQMRTLTNTLEKIDFQDEDADIFKFCLWSLSMMPSGIAINYRLRIFQFLMCGENTNLRLICLDVFPLLLHQLKQKKDILKNILMESRINNYDVAAALAAAKIIGPMTCILVERVSLQRKTIDSFYDGGFFASIVVKCSLCESEEACSSEKDDTQPVRVDVRTVAPFFRFIEFPDNQVKLALINSFKSIFCHVHIDNALVSEFMRFIADDNSMVCRLFCKILPHCLKDSSKITDSVKDTIMEALLSTFRIAEKQLNYGKQETALQAVGYLAKFADHELLKNIVGILSINITARSRAVGSMAHVQLMNVAKIKCMTVQKLFIEFNEVICEGLSNKLHELQKNVPHAVAIVLKKVAITFEYRNIKFFLADNIKHFLPYFMTIANEETSMLLDFYASQSEKYNSKREMLIENFQRIFAHIICSSSDIAVKERLIEFAESQSGVKLSRLIFDDYQSILNYMLLKLGTHYDHIFSGLSYLASLGEGKKVVTTREEMAEFLRPILLAFLTFFDQIFLSTSGPLEEKKLVLKSLTELVQLMGQKHVTPVRMKVMAILRIALQNEDPEFLDLTCAAWLAYVKNIEDSALGPMLCDIMVPLFPLLKTRPQEIANIFKYCIIEKKASLENYFYDLYSIPDIPELNEVADILKEYQTKTNTEEDCRVVLRRSVKAISHGNLDVRTYAFTKLANVLRTSKDSIHQLILGHESLDPIISQLVKVMMVGCRDENTRMRSVIGKCLGELGAIDPGRLEIDKTDFSTSLNDIYCNIQDENFAFNLINEIFRAFRGASDPNHQSCGSYAIQELLKIYNCKPGGTVTSLWNRFPDETQEIFRPWLTSRYQLRNYKGKELSHPIYRSFYGKSYKDWICAWCGHLISKVKQEPHKTVFDSSYAIARYDPNVSLFLLPYALLYALLDGSDEDREQALKEMDAVLSYEAVTEGKRIGQFDLCHMSTQTVFTLLDFLKKWNQKMLQTPTQSGMVVNVLQFLNKISQDRLITAAYQCCAYPRALMYFELLMRSIKSNPQLDVMENLSCALEPRLDMLQNLFCALEEPDAVAGIAAIRKAEPKLTDQIRMHESTSKYQDAFSCYERAISKATGEISNYQGLLNTLMNLGQPNTALTYANGVIAQKAQWTQGLNQFRVEAAWKLSDWSNLDKFLKMESNLCSPNVAIGHVLSVAKNKHKTKYLNLLEEIRNNQMGPLSAVGMENYAYQRGYEYLIRLHMLNEIENGMKVLFNFPSAETETDNPITPTTLFRHWDCRLKFVQSSMRHVEPIMSIRRVILEEAKEKHPLLKSVITRQIASCWLESAKVARKSGNTQHAYSCLLEASNISSKYTFLEMAKWHWSKGEKEQAIISLQKGLDDHYSHNAASSLSEEEKLFWAKSQLLLSRYTDESGNTDSNNLIKMYDQVTKIHCEWEDAYFFHAQYMDRIFSVNDDDKKQWRMVPRIIKAYGLSLQYGSHFVYHSMPRLLSLWMDLGSEIVEKKKNKVQSAEEKIQIDSLTKALDAIKQYIKQFQTKLPPYQFFTAFPQLVSRICHSHKDVFDELKEIIAKLLVSFPQQAMWQIVAVSKSSFSMRRARYTEIINRAININGHLAKFFQDIIKLVDKFLEISNTKNEKLTLNIQVDFPRTFRLFQDPHFSKIMLPLQSAMTVNLPSINSDLATHNPFPQDMVYIQGIEDLVEVMPSLQRPKKVLLRGSNGKIYSVMCKPKDDLRKDCRLMEFNALVNKSLLRDAEARRRQLHIRTYTVVPLNEECGLIEWVPNLNTVRRILHSLYAKRKIPIATKELSRLAQQPNSLSEKERIFKEVFLKRYPSVLSEWFFETFLDPTAWYLVKLNYARTLAVMSMVGYILGLGDRHGENILLDNSCGDVVHVDFNCLFHKGLEFQYPERVPFRLTHNLVDALGLTRTEGIYRKSCEVTLRVMRKQRETLMSVLKPFIHDPLVEWSKPQRTARGSTTTGEIKNEHALVHVQDIEQKLRGIIINEHKAIGLPLSIEGQVNFLIEEATDKKNLCQMYIGWAPHL